MRHDTSHRAAFEDTLRNYRSGDRTSDAHQMIFAVSGVVQLTTKGATWTLPPQRAVWIKAGVDHQIVSKRAEVRTLYFQPDAVKSPARMAVFEVPTLGVELISSILAESPDSPIAAQMLDLLGVMCSQRWADQRWEYYQPVPVTPEVTAACKAAQRDPTISLEGAAKAARCSARTLTRRFQDDIGLPWRSFLLQVRMIRAIELLLETGNVGETCQKVGYKSLGAFSNAFLDFFGFRPSEFSKLGRA